ncbi:hypothetical protein PBY51_019672 [Eleginops maclovinus]|uniref:Uncharacterized protein n=1 Tax=Eleginops maclovinus TaxID=56733 RepID=A0AAN7XK21_ELEMC|nr:hypothetical protein PBY51_019672 [Eleginops maclovinus]
MGISGRWAAVEGGGAAGASCGWEDERGAGWYRTRLHLKSLVFVRERRANSPPVEQRRIITPPPSISQLPPADRGSTRTCCLPPFVSLASVSMLHLRNANPSRGCRSQERA